MNENEFNNTDYETEYFFDDVELLSQIYSLIEDTYKKSTKM